MALQCGDRASHLIPYRRVSELIQGRPSGLVRMRAARKFRHARSCTPHAAKVYRSVALPAPPLESVPPIVITRGGVTPMVRPFIMGPSSYTGAIHRPVCPITARVRGYEMCY